MPCSKKDHELSAVSRRMRCTLAYQQLFEQAKMHSCAQKLNKSDENVTRAKHLNLCNMDFPNSSSRIGLSKPFSFHWHKDSFANRFSFVFLCKTIRIKCVNINSSERVQRDFPCGIAKGREKSKRKNTCIVRARNSRKRKIRSISSSIVLEPQTYHPNSFEKSGKFVCIWFKLEIIRLRSIWRVKFVWRSITPLWTRKMWVRQSTFLRGKLCNNYRININDD